MKESPITLSQLGQLTPLFKDFTAGKHINRLSDPALWLELEQHEDNYRQLFAALGFDLRLDGRGFAWFHTDDASPNVSKTSRQLALLLMVIFDTQADAGKPLFRFSDWVIDRTLLTVAYERHTELLIAENLDVDGLLALLETASRYGFARHSAGHWQLLPAVCRYLDHFEALAAAEADVVNNQMDELNGGDDHREGESIP